MQGNEAIEQGEGSWYMSDEMVPEQWIQHQEIATLPIPYTSPDLMWHGEHSHKLILLS